MTKTVKVAVLFVILLLCTNLGVDTVRAACDNCEPNSLVVYDNVDDVDGVDNVGVIKALISLKIYFLRGKAPPTTEAPITTSTSAAVTTAAPPKTGNEICEEHKRNGSFRDPKDTDCTKYILCYSLQGKWAAMELACKQGYLFDPVSEMCSAPYMCPY